MQPLAHKQKQDAPLGSETQATLHTAAHILSQHLDEVNQLLDTSFSNISSQFITISSLVSKLAKLPDGDERTALTAEISALISKTIMDMQFQDRVSQNLVITMNILKSAAATLNVQHAEALDGTLSDEMVRLLNLGDIKQKFFAYAVERGWVESSAVPKAEAETASADDDDIELF